MTAIAIPEYATPNDPDGLQLFPFATFAEPIETFTITDTMIPVLTAYLFDGWDSRFLRTWADSDAVTDVRDCYPHPYGPLTETAAAQLARSYGGRCSGVVDRMPIYVDVETGEIICSTRCKNTLRRRLASLINSDRADLRAFWNLNWEHAGVTQAQICEFLDVQDTMDPDRVADAVAERLAQRAKDRARYAAA